MKKTFTLLFVVGMFTMAQAQPGARDNRQADQRNDQRNDQRSIGQNDQRDFNGGFENGKVFIEANISFGKDNRYNDRISMERKRDKEIARINQEYDYRIQRVKRSFFMSWNEKQRQVRFLEQQRQQEIKMVYAKFNGYRFDDRNRRYDRNDRSNGHY